MENGTAFSEIIQAFYHYIEQDVDFFSYFELNEEESMEVAGQRAEVLLKEATSYLCNILVVENVFSTVEDDAFAEKLTSVEINLLVKAMFLCYLNRDLTTLRTFHGVMTSSDLNMYSPANERKTFIDMVEKFEDELRIEISEYQMRDRTTGQFVQICE